MTENKKIQLTNDPLTNIRMMVPLLNDKARQRIADVMYGYYINEMHSESEVKQSCKPSKQPV